MRNHPLYRAKGQYAVAVETGAVAAGMAANGELLQFRWTNTSDLAVITEISAPGMRTTTAFAVGTISIKASIARDWTANGTGGTVITPGGDTDVDNAQLRTNMADSVVGNMRISTTAALGAGTKTLETSDLGLITTHSSGGWSSATPIIGSIYLPTTELFKPDITVGQYPLVLGVNEGFVVRATVPATGVWNLGIVVKWAEVDKLEL